MIQELGEEKNKVTAFHNACCPETCLKKCIKERGVKKFNFSLFFPKHMELHYILTHDMSLQSCTYSFCGWKKEEIRKGKYLIMGKKTEKQHAHGGEDTT